MVHDRSSSFSRPLPLAVFGPIKTVMEQTARSVSESALVLTETCLQGQVWQGVERFALVVSPQFSGLLIAQTIAAGSSPERTHPVQLSFSPAAIAAFLTELSDRLPPDTDTVALLQQIAEPLQPNAAPVQSDFTLRLAEVLAQPQPPAEEACDMVVAAAFQQQAEQERLLNQVTTQIRQSMELPVILETAVRQLCPLLQVDRMVIYEFIQPIVISGPMPLLPLPASLVGKTSPGQITYEAKATDKISSVLYLSEGTAWFTEMPNCREKYRKGSTLAISDCEVTYADQPCLLKLMQQSQVRAKLIAPIVVEDKLWGLLIAHQCTEPRLWQDREKTFVRHIAEHLSIAIQQANLYAQVQRQAQTLEGRVIERTQDLRDALAGARSANLAKSEFLATMSHELRTPLTCIIGMTATLLRLPTGRQGEKFLPLDKQRDYLKTIQRSGEHLLELINDILDLSQVEAGKTILEVSDFSLTQVAGESLKMLKDKAHQAEVELKLELQLGSENSGSSDRCLADPRRVKQILLNLLSNAIKFTPPQGQVILRIWREDSATVLQVEDTGIGIPESQHPLLFQKFQQLDPTYHRRYEGTGLGLALTKQLVDLHGGRVEVESAEGVGSSFTVWLPAQDLDAARAKLSPITSVTPPPVQGRIVLVDGQEEVSTFICDLLMIAGYHVIWLSDEPATIGQIEIIQPPTIILSTRSSLDTTDFLRRLRQNPLTQTIPILIATPTVTAPQPQGLEYLLGAPILQGSIDQPEQLLNQIAQLLATRDQSSSRKSS
jgi:two-component system, sensor histidine kinase and response regulator